MTVIGNWQHANLASGSTKISLDYVPQMKQAAPLDPTQIVATVPWINVDGLTPADQVSVHLTYVAKHRLAGYSDRTSIDVPLQYADGGRFTAPIPMELGIKTSGPHTDTIRHAWKLNVLVNGNALTDPMNGSKTFNVDRPLPW